MNCLYYELYFFKSIRAHLTRVVTQDKPAIGFDILQRCLEAPR